ncbi:MAG: hypothetical protein KatS3mg043_0290 [Rhodothermaceae bacterium]|nr:MAG: hypothetical protein KatS3mg043_0290 [Rhodothermaceae bacterium]
MHTTRTRHLLARLLLAAAFGGAGPAAAQFVETFADGDFTQDPAWTGTTAHWAVVPFGDDFALRSDGPTAADTLYLATASTQAYGRWALTFRYEGGALSNFNLVRIFLLADGPDLTGAVRGYHLQLGTNSRDVRLYRSDPDVAGGRTLLGQSAPDVVTDEARTLGVTVTRTEAGDWTVTLDGAPVLAVAETGTPVTTGSHFGLWVKHSATRNRGYFFDDLVVTPGLEDMTPPVVTGVTYEVTLPGFFARFSELIDFSSIDGDDVSVPGIDRIVSMSPVSGVNETDGISIQLATFLPSGDYDVRLRDIADLAGNVLRDTTVTVTVVADETPPVLLGAEAISATEVHVTFDEPVGLDPGAFTLSENVTVTGILNPMIPEFPYAEVVMLEVFPPLAPGITYTLTVHDLADPFGNVLEEAAAAFTFSGEPFVPAPGDVVVNEILYAPPPGGSEYVELLNRTGHTLDLRAFRLADDRNSPVPLTTETTALPPGGFAVLAQDSAAFAAAFPGVPFLPVENFPALNNAGDAVVLFFEETVLDSVAYRPGWGGAGGAALERRDPAGPSNLALNWGTSTDPRGGTPGAVNTLFAPDTTPPALLSALPARTGDTLTVTFSEPLDPATVTPGDFTIENGGTVTPETVSVDEATATLVLAMPLPPGTYRLVVRDVADFFGNILAEDVRAFTVLAPVTPARGEVVVNEIHYAPPPGGSEYVELLNRTGHTLDLRAFRLADDRNSPVPLTTETTALPPGGFAVLAQDSAAFAAAFPGVPFLPVENFPALNNAGDAVVLFFEETVLDSVAYRPGWGGAGGAALERRDPAGPSNLALNWGTSTDPRGGTPGAVNTLFAPDTTPPHPFFADQVGERQAEVFFSEPLDPATVTPGDFALDGTGPAALVLAEGDTRVRLTFDAGLPGLSQPNPLMLTVRDVADLTGNVLAEATVPLARQAAPGDVVVNEILYEPRADPRDGFIDQPEYIELFNRSGHLISLRGLFRTNVPDETGAADTTRLAPDPVAIAPGGFAVVFAEPKVLDEDALYAQSSLVLAFPEDYRRLGVTLLPVRAATLGLRNDGDLVRLHRPDGTVVDEVVYDPAWHDAARATTQGVALERIDPDAPAQAATNWASATAPAGGTPGRPNSVAPVTARPPQPGELVVNEILYEPRADPGDGHPDQPEYFELFNRTGEPLALNGLLLTGRPDEQGRADTLRIAFTPVALPPGGFAVVYGVPPGTPDDSLRLVLERPFPTLPAGDPGLVLLPLRRSLAPDNAGDLVRLHRPDGTIVDEVAYDPAWHHPGLRERRGTALERIDPDAPAGLASNWTSSVAPAGGTPGARNSVYLRPGEPRAAPGLVVEPSPFSPDRDGHEDVTAIRYTLRQAPALVRARIFDAGGRLVRTLEAAALAGRSGTLFWDGLDDHARPLRVGIYVVHLEAIAADAGTREAYKAPVVLARPLD